MIRLRPLPRKQQNVLPEAIEAVPPAAALPRSKSNRVHDISRTNLAADINDNIKPVEETKEDDKPAEEEKKDCTKPAEEAEEEKADTAQRKSQQYTAACTWPSDAQMRTFQQCALSCKEQQIALHVEVAELKRLGLINHKKEEKLYRLIHQRDPDIIRTIMENAGISKADATGEADSSGKEEQRQQEELKAKKLKVALEKHSATAPQADNQEEQAADVKPFLSYRLQFKRTIKRSSANILQVPATVFKENVFNVHLVRYFVENVWKLYQPDVIISITGGAQNFDLPPEHKDRMMRGMMEGTRQMKPWSASAFTVFLFCPFVGA